MAGLMQTFWLYSSYFIDFLFGLYYRNKKQIIVSPKSPIVLLSASELARKIRNKTLKSEDVVRAFTERIKEVNEILNAVVDERFEDALTEARQIDEDIESGKFTEEDYIKKPFLGIPFTSKETSQCKGMNATFGLNPRKGMKATEDADIVKNMKGAGGILLALTNVPQLNMWWETHNPIYGRTNNPYNTTVNAGGSSGGEGAILAACGSPIGVASDIGGSIRIPCYMCGLFGHKASATLTPTRGMTFRDGSESSTTMVVAGPMTKYAEDLIPGVKAILGEPAISKLSLDVPVDVKKLRYHYVIDTKDVYNSSLRPNVRDAIMKVVNHFKNFGPVSEETFDDLKSVVTLYRYWIVNEKGSNFKFDITNKEFETSAFKELFKWIIRTGELDFSSVMFLLNNAIMPTVNEKWAIETTEKLRSAMIKMLGDDGILFYPSMPTTAHHHHVSYFRPYQLAYMGVFNVLKLPVTQVPLGLSEDGLPLGVQVVAAPFKDHLCIAVAKELEKVFGGFVPPFRMAP